MRTILVSLFAASLAYVFNSIIIRKIGLAVLTDLIPIIEEFLKTYTAVQFKIPILYDHLIFGMVEAITDFYAGEKLAALLSIASHASFGLLATYVYNHLGLLWSLAASSVAHMIYNKIMLTK